MFPKNTQTRGGKHRAQSSLSVGDVIELRRRRQSRGQLVLRPGETIGYLPYRDCAIRVRYIDESLLDIDGCHGPVPSSFELCAQLELPWLHIAAVRHRWAKPSLDWTDNAPAPWFDAQGCSNLTAKILDAYYHVLKGYALNADDGILINPEPNWIAATATTT